QTIGQEIRAKQESEMTKLTALANFLKKSNYPYCLLKAQAQFDRKLITYSGSKASVTYTITVTFDEERFDDLVQPMLPMLDDLASKKQQGTIRQVSVSVKQLNAHGSGSTEKTVSMFGGNAFPERVSSDYIQLYVNTERTAGLKATQWMAYVLPKRSVLLLNLMERTVPAVRVAFLDSRGQEVTYRYVPGINSQCAVNGFYGKNRVIYGRSERFLEDEGENKHAESGLLFPRRYQAAPGRMSGSVSYPDYDTADVIHFMCPFGYTQYTSLNSRSYLSGGQFFSEFLMTVEATMPVEKLEQIDHLECTIVSENSAQDSAWLKLPDALKYYTDQVR
ncbi:MAG: hypothetical protein PHQ75_14320, partial [Thermoguttaceae bacterium]|nr:hypothetical protein [Thermoguttaceae bacterium]